MESKYYDMILAAQAEDEGHSKLETFDLDSLAPKTALKRLQSRFARQALKPLLWLAREFRPIFKLSGFTWITRDRDVKQILEHPDLFRVPYGLEMRELAGGADFVLGVDGPGQQRQNAIIARILLPEDRVKLIDWAGRFSASLVEGGAGRLDVIADFAARVPTEICRRYFGLDFSNPNAFADWSLSLSALLFADPGGDKDTRQLALLGAARLRHVIDVAIERTKDRDLSNISPVDLTLVERLIKLQATEPDLKLSYLEIRAILLGLVVGFVPTNSLAAGNMFEEIFRQTAALGLARQAAREGDREGMREIVQELGRLNPALAPGQWRIVERDTKIARGTGYARTVRKGELLMVATASALRDRRAYRRPSRFKLGRDHRSSLVFGHASHRCLGEHLSLTILTEMFIVLFRQSKLRLASDRHGKMQRAGYFPRRLEVQYDAPGAKQTMIIVNLPLEQGVKPERVDAAVRALGNPAKGDAADDLERCEIVHFASATLVRGGQGEDQEPHHLLMEFNVDGERSQAIRTIAEECGGWLADIVRLCAPSDPRDWDEVLRAGCLDLSFNPWRTTGLNFFGIGELSVGRIEKQRQLRNLIEAHVQSFLRDQERVQRGLGQRAMLILTAVRRAIRNDPAHAALDAFLVQPSRKHLALARWRKPKLSTSKLVNFVQAGRRPLLFLLVPTFILAAILFYMAMPGGSAGALSFVGHLAMVAVLAAVSTVLIWAGLFAAAAAIFAFVTAREKPDDRSPEHDHVRALLALENDPDYRQNHITAVTLLKPGIVRRLSLALGLWGIRQSLQWFRPGFVVTMGTIHFAKWFRLPGSRKLIFQSNYDGSWESYLEDFITRAHPGQTAAWSNGVGFPKSEGLTGEGARDGDRFKRWVRRQQVPTAFWYCRFPGLTAHEKRTNALVHSGLVNAHTDTAARSWLDLIGSAQRQPYELENQEIQSLVFRGLKRAVFTACLPLKLPEAKEDRGRWLRSLLPDKVEMNLVGGPPSLLSFGKFPEVENEALYLALSAEGLRKFSADGSGQGERLDLLKGFSAAFAQGMAARGGILGDASPADPEEAWRWMDATSANAEAGVADGVLIIYAPGRERLEECIDGHLNWLRSMGGKIVHDVIRTVTLDEKRKVVEEASSGMASYEHFGFRDGIATPIIRGTEKFTPRGDAIDVVEPGEFILGYRSNQGYFAPSVMVPAVTDRGLHLPIAADRTAYGFANFETDDQFSDRDFGRNGSFIAIRQFVQDVDGFEGYTAEQAVKLRDEYGRARLKEVVGTEVTPKWVAAKMVGRWPDGRPLVGNPTEENVFNDQRPDNDFSFGRDDPRGQACPLGAHIRRANPRDSLEPDDPLEREIVKRHALMRRGRVYYRDPASGEYLTRTPDGPSEKGLLFVGLCADLERQFEMMQQSWLNFRSFHGLRNEVDPITARRRQSQGCTFTIPTGSGPLKLGDFHGFVDVVGGGYFFLPSRSALRYLVNFTQDLATQSVPGPALKARHQVAFATTQAGEEHL